MHKLKSMSVLLKSESVPVLKENKKYAMHIFVLCTLCKDLFSKYLLLFLMTPPECKLQGSQNLDLSLSTSDLELGSQDSCCGFCMWENWGMCFFWLCLFPQGKSSKELWVPSDQEPDLRLPPCWEYLAQMVLSPPSWVSYPQPRWLQRNSRSLVVEDRP